MDSYDVIVIGSGPAGTAAAIRCAQAGKRIALIEKDTLGGRCAAMGADPTKSLIEDAKIICSIKKLAVRHGVSFADLSTNFAASIKRSREVAKASKEISERKLKSNQNIEIFQGSAFLDAPDLVSIRSGIKITKKFKAKDIIIATGVDPFDDPKFATDGKYLLNYKHAILQEQLPQSITIIGGGALGLEMASFWSAYGATVSIVESMPSLAPYEDEEIGDAIAKFFHQQGINLYLSSQIAHFEKASAQLHVAILSPAGKQFITTSQVLETFNFKHNSTNMGLEKIGVNLGSSGVIITNDQLQTNIPHIWAVGDVNGKLMLATAGRAMGLHCANQIIGYPSPDPNYLMMPKITYCIPQIASFGYTEKQAEEKGFRFHVLRADFSGQTKAHCNDEIQGWIKVLVEKGTDKILGAHMIGNQVEDIIAQLTLCQSSGIPFSDLGSAIHGHPTLSEIIGDLARNHQFSN